MDQRLKRGNLISHQNHPCANSKMPGKQIKSYSVPFSFENAFLAYILLLVTNKFSCLDISSLNCDTKSLNEGSRRTTFTDTAKIRCILSNEFRFCNSVYKARLATRANWNLNNEQIFIGNQKLPNGESKYICQPFSKNRFFNLLRN